jgi:hypothetical protein
MLNPRKRQATFFCWMCYLAAAVTAASVLRIAASDAAENAESASAKAESRVRETISFLASDELEGRGVDTQGINKAAEYLAEEFKKLGLKTDLFDGTPFQKFTMTVGAELGQKNELAIVGPPKADGSPQRIELKLGVDYTPLSIGGSGKIDVPLAFVGYGITAKIGGDAADPHAGLPNPHAPKAEEKKPATPAESKAVEKAVDAKAEKPTAKPAKATEPVDPHSFSYDDYAGIDVKGKAVIALRHEPEQKNPHSFFNGTDHSMWAPFNRKLSNAFEHGAAAAIFVTDEYEIRVRMEGRRKLWQTAVDELAELHAKFKKEKKPTDEQIAKFHAEVEKAAKEILDQGKKLEEERDPLLNFRGAGSTGDSTRLPTMHMRRAVVDRLLAAADKSTLSKLETKIDEGPAPASFVLEGWRLVGEVDVRRVEAEVKNVAAVLEGDGPHADETIIIGAHYDHLGLGGEGSFTPTKREVHNGADDNASGTTALLETARQLVELSKQKKLPRRVMFMAFTGEEKGLIGSARYCREPLFPLEKTVAMLNMDMVGRLKDEKLTVQGGDTADEFKKVLDDLNGSKYHFQLTHQSGGLGPSDHASFYTKKIPVLHFFTGLHGDYHRPSDDADKINAPGLVRVAGMVTDVATAVAEMANRPTYKEVKSSSHGGSGSGSGGSRPYFGSIPDYSQDQPGLLLSGVSKDGPADKAGLKSGDIIIKLGDSNIGNIDDFDGALRKFKAGDKVIVVVKREGKEHVASVTLGAPK